MSGSVGFELHSATDQAVAARTSFGAKSCTSFDFTRFLIMFAAAHLFLYSTSFDQLSEAADRFLDRFSFSQRQFDHKNHPFIIR